MLVWPAVFFLFMNGLLSYSALSILSAEYNCQYRICFFYRSKTKFEPVQCPTREKNPNAVALGRLGAKARQEKLTPERRREIAQKAIRARWAKARKKKSSR